MIDMLLMAGTGGTGTLYGAVVGAILLVTAQNYLHRVLEAAAATADWTLVARLVHPDRSLLLLGALFVLVVYFFLEGLVGRLRRRAGRTEELGAPPT